MTCCPPTQGLYALVVYFFVSWHTLTRKHNKYNVGDEVEALGVPGEKDDDDHYGNLGSVSLSTFASSKEQLVDKVKLYSHKTSQRCHQKEHTVRNCTIPIYVFGCEIIMRA